MSRVSVLITHCRIVGVNLRRAVTKVPQAVHGVGSRCDDGVESHRLIDEGVLRQRVQDGRFQLVLHHDVLGDVLSVQGVEGPQVDGQYTRLFWRVENLRPSGTYHRYCA